MGSFLNSIMSRIDAAKKASPSNNSKESPEDVENVSYNQDETQPNGQTATGRNPTKVALDPDLDDMDVDPNSKNDQRCSVCGAKNCTKHRNAVNNPGNQPGLIGGFKEDVDNSSRYDKHIEPLKNLIKDALKKSNVPYNDVVHTGLHDGQHHGLFHRYDVKLKDHKDIDRVGQALKDNGVNWWQHNAMHGPKDESYVDLSVHIPGTKPDPRARNHPAAVKEDFDQKFTEHNDVRKWKREAKKRYGKVSFKHDEGLSQLTAHAEGHPNRVGTFTFNGNKGIIGEEKASNPDNYDVFHHSVLGKVLYDRKNDRVARFTQDGAIEAANKHEANGGKVIAIHKHPWEGTKSKKRYYVQTSYQDKTTI